MGRIEEQGMSPERVICIVANVGLVCGCVYAVALLVEYTKMNFFIGLLLAILAVMVSIVVWAFTKIIANISLNIMHMEDTMAAKLAAIESELHELRKMKQQDAVKAQPSPSPTPKPAAPKEAKPEPAKPVVANNIPTDDSITAVGNLKKGSTVLVKSSGEAGTITGFTSDRQVVCSVNCEDKIVSADDIELL